MKKLSILLIGLLLISGFAFAETMISISGSSTLEWGFGGQLIDNSSNFAGVDVPSFFTDDSGKHKWGPKDVKLTLEAADEDGMVIVKAESKLDLDNDDEIVQLDTELKDAFQFIEFPNVIPGTLGIKLMKADELTTDVTSADSTTSVPHAYFTITPMEGLTAKVGLAINIGELKSQTFEGTDTVETELDIQVADTTTYPTTGFADGVTPLYETYTAGNNGDGVVDDTEEWVVEVSTTTTTIDTDIDFVNGSYVAFATSLYLEYMLTLSETDSVTVALGTIIDTAYSNSVYDKKNADGDDDDGDTRIEAWGAKKIVSKDAAIDSTKNETKGFATFPIGLGVDAAIAGATVGLDFQTRLVQGVDVDDVDKNGAIRAGYAIPLFVGFDAAYDLAMGDMTITPSASFKYSSDFWKWGLNDDGDDIEYKGLVSAADILGRPMSAGVGVSVAGIAGLLDVDLDATLGFGDGEYAHGFAPTATTLQKGLDDALKAAGTDVAKVNDAPLFAASPLAIDLGLGLTATPMAGVKVTNDTGYALDNLGVLGADEGSLYGNFLSEITNDTKVTYDIVVAENVAAQFFGELNWATTNFASEDGTTYNDNFVATATEQESKNTLDYAIGVSATVSF